MQLVCGVIMKMLVTLCAAVLLLSGCGAAQSPATSVPIKAADAVPSPRPDDFRIDYFWSKGALPPPHAYSISILIEGGGRGTAILKAPALNGPEQSWQETFDIAPKQMDAVHELMKRSGVLDGGPLPASDPAPGASTTSMKIIASGKEVTVSDTVGGNKQQMVAALFGAVRALAAPAEDKLQTLYNAWIKTQQ